MANGVSKGDFDRCEQYIDKAIKDGICTLQMLGIHNIKLDRKLQAREKEFHEDHVMQLRQIIDRESAASGTEYQLAAVSVFLINGLYWLVDGFHRWHAYSQSGRRDIRAHVIKGTWAEAVQFAAMANQRNTMKPMSRADVQRAVRILLESDECWNWGDRVVAKHVGCSDTVVTRMRAMICEETGRQKPDFILKSNGILGRSSQSEGIGDRVISVPIPRGGARSGARNRRNGRSPGQDGYIEPRGPNAASASVFGKQVQGANRTEVAAKVSSIMASAADIANIVSTTPKAAHYLARHGIYSEVVRIPWSAPKGWPSCLRVRGCVVGLCGFGSAQEIFQAVGQVGFAKEYIGGNPRAFVMCNPELGNTRYMEFFSSRMGIDFVTPEQFVDRIAQVGDGEGVVSNVS